MITQFRTSNNLWFTVPFIAWMLFGAMMLTLFSRDTLFAAVNLHHNGFLDVLMLFATWVGDGIGVVIILLLVMLFFKSCRNWWYFLLALVCNVLPSLFIQLLKNHFNAPRPFEFYKAHPGWIHFDASWGEHLLHNSFPSGHSGAAFSVFCFLSMILPDGWRRLGFLLLLLAFLVSYSRMYLAAHFFLDVYAGSILGATITMLSFSLMSLWAKRSFRIVLNGTEKKNTTAE